jgi:hypothetical protein
VLGDFLHVHLERHQGYAQRNKPRQTHERGLQSLGPSRLPGASTSSMSGLGGDTSLFLFDGLPSRERASRLPYRRLAILAPLPRSGRRGRMIRLAGTARISSRLPALPSGRRRFGLIAHSTCSGRRGPSSRNFLTTAQKPVTVKPNYTTNRIVSADKDWPCRGLTAPDHPCRHGTASRRKRLVVPPYPAGAT